MNLHAENDTLTIQVLIPHLYWKVRGEGSADFLCSDAFC